METGTIEEEKEEGEEEITREPSTVVNTVVPLDLLWFVRKAPKGMFMEVIISVPTRRIRKLCAASTEIRRFCVKNLDKYFWLATWESDTRMLKDIRIENHDDQKNFTDLLNAVELLAEIIYKNPTWAPYWITGGLEFPTAQHEVKWATHPRILKIRETVPGEEPEEPEESVWKAWLEGSTTLQAFARFEALMAEPRFVPPILGDRLVLLVDRKGGFWEKGNTNDQNDADNYLREPTLDITVAARFAGFVRDAHDEPGPAKKVPKISETRGITRGGGEGEEEDEDIGTRFLTNGEYRWTRAIPGDVPIAPWARRSGSSWLGRDIRVERGEPGAEDPNRLGIASDVFYFVGPPREDFGPGGLLLDSLSYTNLALSFQRFRIEKGNIVPKELFKDGTLPTPEEVEEITLDTLRIYRLMMLVAGVKIEMGPVNGPAFDKRDSKVLYDTSRVGSRLVSGKKVQVKDLAYYYYHSYSGNLKVGDPKVGDPIIVSHRKIMKSETGNIFVYFYVLLRYEVINGGGYRFVSAQAEPFRLKFSNRDFVDRIYTEDFEAKYVINREDRNETSNRFRDLSRKSSATGRVPSLSDITRDVGRMLRERT